MDLQLIKTFLEVAETGSFAAASERLFVTQSAVSLRVQRLEDQLGRPCSSAQRAGVILTAGGARISRLCHPDPAQLGSGPPACQRAGHGAVALAIGAQPSLWPRFGFRWLDRLRPQMPDLSIRAEMARPDALAQMILSGAVQVVLIYRAAEPPRTASRTIDGRSAGYGGALA